jgi:hypothetical protein
MGLPCESGARIELLGLLAYEFRPEGDVPYCDGEVPNCDDSGARVVLDWEAIDRGTLSSIDPDEFLGSVGELEGV